MINAHNKTRSIQDEYKGKHEDLFFNFFKLRIKGWERLLTLVVRSGSSHWRSWVWTRPPLPLHIWVFITLRELCLSLPAYENSHHLTCVISVMSLRYSLFVVKKHNILWMELSQETNQDGPNLKCPDMDQKSTPSQLSIVKKMMKLLQRVRNKFQEHAFKFRNT